jgi:hypothetical protein
MEGPVYVAPGKGCTCGIFAPKTIGHAAFSAVTGRLTGSGIIVGSVELAGKVIEHDPGYRAQFARLKLLMPMKGQESEAETLAVALGIGVSSVLSALEPSPLSGRLRRLPRRRLPPQSEARRLRLIVSSRP